MGFAFWQTDQCPGSTVLLDGKNLEAEQAHMGLDHGSPAS